MGVISALLGLLGCEKKNDLPYEMSETYLGLRELVFNLDPQTVSATDPDKSIYAVLMETGIPQGIVTLAAINDGTVSLYFSNGGGILGSGEYEKPRRICMEYLQAAQSYLGQCTKTSERTLPNRGQTKFYFFTIDDGILTAVAKEDDLGCNRHNLSPLFHKAQELIAAILEKDEEKTNEE